MSHCKQKKGSKIKGLRSLYILITLTCAAALSDLLQHFFREEINHLSLIIYF